MGEIRISGGAEETTKDGNGHVHEHEHVHRTERLARADEHR